MKKLVLGMAIIVATYHGFSQNIPDSLFITIQEGIKLKTNKSQTLEWNVGIHSQIWMRYMQLNPNTTNDQNQNIKNDFDLLLRQTSFTSHLTFDRFSFFIQTALTPQSHLTSTNSNAPGKVQFFCYDAWGSVKLYDNYLITGAGLNMYNGISRYSSASATKSLTADVPLSALPSLSTDDQSGRQLGIFITGNIGSFGYRAAITKPFVTKALPDTPEFGITYFQPNHNLSYKGYFEWHFFDKESNALPFKTGTYVGEKKILSIGFGFDFHTDATITFSTVNNFKENNATHLALDLFMEYPFQNRSAITLYAAQFWNDFGPKFTNSTGFADIYNHGISEIVLGTGTTTLIQTAYLLPSKNKSVRIQPFYECTYRNYDGLKIPIFHHNTGLNYYIVGHKIKGTIQYENRPFYEDNSTIRRSLVILKMQFSI